MNNLGISLIWLIGQVTLLCSVTAVIYFIARRRHPAAGATAALSGLLLAAVLTLLVVSPWPRWEFNSQFKVTVNNSATSTQDESTVPITSDTGELLPIPMPSEGQESQASDVELESTPTAAWTAFWQGLRQELMEPRPQPVQAGFRWTAWLVITFLVAGIVGTLRLLAGWLTVRRCLRRSTLVNDRSLQEAIDILRAEFDCRRHVELRESRDVASAATVGWRKPVILLPPNWRNWSYTERQTVLAHELAHVTAGDAATWLLAQVGLLLHFYHPLVHWLTHRLRLEQELAADARAANLSGGSQTYLTTLAELAVRQPDRPIAWPTRAFLPTRGTLLRRIEMLRDTKSPPLHSSKVRHVAVIALTLAASVFIVGLRPPASQIAQAQPTASTANAESLATFNLENVPASTSVLWGVRPAQMAERPDLQPLIKLFNDDWTSSERGVTLEDLSQLLVIGMQDSAVDVEGRVAMFPVFEYRMKEPMDFAGFIKAEVGAGGEVELQLVGEDAMWVRIGADIGPNTQVAHVLDYQTLLSGSSDGIAKLLEARRRREQPPAWTAELSSVADSDMFAVADMTKLRTVLQNQFQQDPNPMYGMLAPLWQNTDLMIWRATLGDQLGLALDMWSPDAMGAAKVEERVKMLVPLGQGMLESLKAQLAKMPAESRQANESAIRIGEEALNNLKVETTEDRVTVSLDTEADGLAKIVATMLPAVSAAREAARRTQTRNNLKRIGLAFHNYNDVFGHFPPPVVYGQSGSGKSQHPHSWRVAILPFVEAADLYGEYHFDEPWDSDHNKTILERMPPVFRSPNDDSNSTNAAYYALVGQDTAVGGTGQPTKGVKFSDITDGMSNTLLVVEAKRDIPWTKPEDITYSPDKDVPEFGGWHEGGFHALIADGSVMFIANTIDEAILRALITRDGGEAVPR